MRPLESVTVALPSLAIVRPVSEDTKLTVWLATALLLLSLTSVVTTVLVLPSDVGSLGASAVSVS
jgi:hypothetical protein